MFRITKDPSSGSSIQCLAKITVKNASLGCSVHTSITGKYPTIIPTTSISTYEIEPLLQTPNFLPFWKVYFLSLGISVAQWVRCCATNRKEAGSNPDGVGGFFIDIKSFRPHYGPGFDSASNRNEYQEYFLG